MTDTSSVTFAAEIRRVAAGLSRAPTDAQVDELEALTRSRTYIDNDAVVLNDGGDLGAFIARECNNFGLVQAEPEPAAPDAWVKIQFGTGTSWRRSNDPMTAIVRGLQASDDAALAREIPSYGNPWLPGRINRTHQAIITRSDPALAAKFKSEAGTAK